jgi:hypothetical protein
MQMFVKILPLVVVLSACGIGKDSRYRDTEMLERPPTLAVVKTPESEAVACCDDPVIPKKKYKKGLHEAVALTKTKPHQIKINQGFEEAWLTLGLALAQSEIKIADKEKDKGLYYVAYNPSSITDAVTSLFSSEQKLVIYVLKAKAEGEVTYISAKLANASEQKNSLEKDRFDEDAGDDAEDLLYKVFETLRDDLEN